MLSRRKFLQVTGAGLAGAMLWPQVKAAGQTIGVGGGARKMNVLMIVVDDLRPQLGCYGDPLAATPNIDQLGRNGTVFTGAYTPQAICSPARTSVLTGLRPDTTKVWDLVTHFRKTVPDVVTLPQLFKQAGYVALGFSKVYHDGLDDPASWSAPLYWPEAPTYAIKENRDYVAARQAEAKEKNIKSGDVPHFTRGPAYEAADVSDETYADGMTAAEAIKTLGQVKDKAFFLAVGFKKPHLPFVSPKKYWDMYQRDSIHVADNPFVPKDCPEVAYTDWPELRGFKGMPEHGPVDDETAKTLIHAYHAAVSYTDAQIGKVIGELDRLGLRENTVIVLVADHGWKLGEHGWWSKHTNFEQDTRVPLILSLPGQKGAGKNCPALVETVDVYPTLCALCGLGRPKQELEGTSFAPLLDEPGRAWKKAVFTQHPRGAGFAFMGHSMRTERYRFTIWKDKKGQVVATELYDHQGDPKENVNVAGRAENAAVVKELTQQLQAGWKGMVPA